MFKSFRMFLAVLLMLSVVSVAQAAVYGYIVVTGKKPDLIAREVSTFEKLVKTWKNGEVLYVHNTVSGLVFKKYSSIVVFAGEQAQISPFLTSGAYEGDYLKDIVVCYDYISDVHGEIRSGATVKYRNIREAIKVLKDKENNADIWADLAKRNKAQYKKHLYEDGTILGGVVNVFFFNVQQREENRLFGATVTENGMRKFR